MRAEASPPDPIVVADEHWRARGWDAGPYLRASLSVYRADDAIREDDELALRPRRLTRSKHETLAVLYFSRQGQLPLGKLGQRLLVHPTSVTSMIDSLERLGLVERVDHPTDRRATLARISPYGRQVMAATCSEFAARRCGVAALAGDEADRVFEILRKVRARAGDLERSRPDGSPDDGDPVLAAERGWEAEGWTARPWFRASLSIYRTAELLRGGTEVALRPHGLTHARHEALAVLYSSALGEMSMGLLSAHLLVHPTSTTSTIDALERLGYVRRVAHATDRRTTLARITPAGRRAVEATMQSMAEAAWGLGALSSRDARTLFRLLAKVRPLDHAAARVVALAPRT